MIRIAELADLPSITAIYNEAVASRCSGDLSPVTVDSRMLWFSEHIPERYPIFVACEGHEISGWCSLSPYRKGREALRYTAEISYYVASAHRRKGVALSLINYARAQVSALSLKTLFAIVLENNAPSRRLLERTGFTTWGFLPGVADFGDFECGQYYYGLKINPPNKAPEPTPMSVTPAADAPVAPDTGAARL
jgi:L-amino acid N-acyltransferase YncA